MHLSRRLRWGAAGVVVAAVAVGLAVQRREHARLQYDQSRLQHVAENTKRAEELKAAIDVRFPPGTPEADVLVSLEKEHPDYSKWPGGDWVEYGLPVGIEQNNEWFCGSWERGVKLRFERGRLVRSSVERWSTDCL